MTLQPFVLYPNDTQKDSQVASSLKPGRTVLEASAGTGKTYSLAGLVLRAIALDGIALSDILVVTFTRAATAELRERIRVLLADCHSHLENI